MLNSQKPIESHTFHRLKGALKSSEHIPLLAWWDRVTGEDRGINRHEDFLSLYLVKSGRGTHVVDRVPYAVARGDVYVMGLGMEHYFTGCDALVTHTLHFSPEIFDRRTREILIDAPGFLSLFVEDPMKVGASNGNGGRWLHLTPEAFDAMEDDIAELRAEWQSGTADGALIAKGLFLRLLVHLARHYASSYQAAGLGVVAPSGLRDMTVASALRIIDTRFTEPLRIEQIAASVFLSPDRFTEVFAATVGRTPRDYIRHLRLEKAKSLLSTTDEAISTIALESGFGESAYFTRVFHAATGITPSAYRTSNRVVKQR